MLCSTKKPRRSHCARALSGLLAGLALLTAATIGARASAISYPDFSNINGLSLNGYYGPQRVGTALRLVQAAYSQSDGAWTTGKVYVQQGFNTTFTFQLSGEVGPNGHGADGFTFDIQNVGNYITTGEGGTGADPSNAVTVSIRDFQNGLPGDVSDNVIKIFGNNQTLIAYLDLYSLNINVHDDQPHTVNVAYDGANMSLTIDGKTAPAITNVAVPLGTAMDASGFAYAGFGGRTGGYYQNVDILSWMLTSPSPIAGLGLGGPFAYPDFSSLTDLKLVNNAAQSGSLIQLTQAVNSQSNGAWYDLREPVSRGFDTTFQFQLANENGGADGFAFNVTTDGFVAGGEGGTGGSSIAVGIDTYQNTGEPSSNFVKLINSTGTIIQTQDLTPFGIDVHDDLPHTVAVHYDGANISVTVDSMAIYTNVALPLGSAAQADGTALVGFTARTGGLSEEIDLRSWSFALPGATVTGNIALEGVADLSATNPAAPLGVFDIQIRNTGSLTPLFESKTVTLTKTAGSANGKFSLNVTGVPAGTYDVWIKGKKSLAVLVPGVAISATSGTVPTAFLPGGDTDNSNTVDATDFGIFVGAYNSAVNIPGSGYDPNADLNFDGFVDATDFGVFVGNYNTVGAP